MVCESFSLWHFYEGYVYVPFIFILLVLIAVYWTLLLCTETTCLPAAVWPQQLEMVRLEELILWRLELSYDTVDKRTEWVDSLGAAYGSQKASHAPLDEDFVFGIDSELYCGHFLWRECCVEDSKRYTRATTTTFSTIRPSLGLSAIYWFFFPLD